MKIKHIKGILFIAIIIFALVYIGYELSGPIERKIRYENMTDLRIVFNNNRELFESMKDLMLEKPNNTNIIMYRFKIDKSFEDTDPIFKKLYKYCGINHVYKYDGRIVFNDFYQGIVYTELPKEEMKQKYTFCETLEENWYYTVTPSSPWDVTTAHPVNWD